ATGAARARRRAERRGRVGVVAVVEPESGLAARSTRNGRVGLLATPATVASGAYERALKEAAPDAHLHAVACPELAPMIQAGDEFDQRTVDTVEAYCEPLRKAAVDTVILGCTHYPLVRPVLQRALGRGVTIVSSGEAIADEVEVALRAAGTENDPDRRGDYRFLATGDPHEFRRLGTRFLQLPIGEVRRGRVGVVAVRGVGGGGGRRGGAGGGARVGGARGLGWRVGWAAGGPRRAGGGARGSWGGWVSRGVCSLCSLDDNRSSLLFFFF